MICAWLMVVTASAATQIPKAPPQIVVLGTGGTIAGRGPSDGPVGYTAATVGVEDLLTALPQLGRIARVRGEQVLQLPSQEIRPSHWLTLARRAQAHLEDPACDGLVVTHGTDTLEETAYFLNLVLNTDKPVVLVGAMRPVTALSADGPFNLYEAVRVAGHPDARGAGVLVLLDDVVHSARDVTKANTSRQDAFQSPDNGALGSLQGDAVYFYRRPTRRHTKGSAMEVRQVTALPEVGIVHVFAGTNGKVVDAQVAQGVQGLVVAGVGNGNFGKELGEALDRAVKKGVVVVRASRVGGGNIARNDEVNDDVRGFVTADNLLPQKARILLMLALLKTREVTRIQTLFDTY